MQLLKDLTDAQKRAVIHDGGPALVVAGAGTGKTTVITRRIAWLITEKKVNPEEILAVTFTEKAALEMEERVDALVPYGFVDTWILTFHAFCDRILRDHAIELDLPVDFRVLTEPEQVMILRDNIFSIDLKHLRPPVNPNRYVRDLVRYFSKIKDEDISSNEYIEFAAKELKDAKDAEEKEAAEIQMDIARAFSSYNEALHGGGYIDFGDQISLALRLFRENPRILKEYQNKFRYILVDEFQDTNFAQNELLKLLAPKEANLMAVGDDDQSIYRFRGAAISNILSFIKNWPQAKQIVLTENFRSASQVLDRSYELITQNNPNRLEITNKINKKLKATGENAKSSGSVQYSLSQTLSGEADLVAQEINKQKKEGIPHKEMAILIRKNTDSRPFELALSAKKFPLNLAVIMDFTPVPKLLIF
jgi:DNA helicase II / ATP-dependent DNA helicase PcrA